MEQGETLSSPSSAGADSPSTWDWIAATHTLSGAAVRAGAAVRELNRALVGSTAPDDVLDAVTAEVERLVERLAPHARQSRYDQAQAISGSGTFANHPMIGPANPCAPPITLHRSEDGLVGDVRFGTPQEGPPGCAYGGYLAAGFDAILLMTAGAAGVGGPTRSLTVRYRKPTPLQSPLQYVGRVSEVAERSTHVKGALVGPDGTVYVEGEASVARGARIGG
ncbi:MAG TPA: hotdog fold domain-containing protein [Acidimicrobiales bacterium]|nr:hotdog fold domain-containing protein [Acidimicrobiales bacterium]